MSGLVGNPEDRFSYNEAHMYKIICFYLQCRRLFHPYKYGHVSFSSRYTFEMVISLINQLSRRINNIKKSLILKHLFTNR